MENKDYYSILGVSKTATQDEIKKAFRKLSKIHHPDAGGKEEKFKEIAGAYDVLGDEQKRKEYDSPAPNFGGYGSSTTNNGQRRSYAHQNMHDFFYGSGTSDYDQYIRDQQSGRTQQRTYPKPSGENIRITVDVNLSDTFKDINKKVKLSKKNKCKPCDGYGGKDLQTCTKCGGTGKVESIKHTVFEFVRVMSDCPQCAGAGKIPKMKCNSCSGSGVKPENEEIEFTIPKGVSNGVEFVVPEKGSYKKASTAGDLHVVVRVKNDTDFTLDERNNLTKRVQLNYLDIIFGTQINVTMPDKSERKIDIPAGFSNDMVIINGAGMFLQYGRSNVVLNIKPILPNYNSLPQDKKDLLNKLKNG